MGLKVSASLFGRPLLDLERNDADGLVDPLRSPVSSSHPAQFELLPTSGTAANGKTILNWDQAAAQIGRENLDWGAGATVTYAFRATAPSPMPETTSGFSQFSAAQIAAAEQALQYWADVANVTFTRVNPGGYSNNATILFGNYSTGPAGVAGFAYLPGLTDPAVSDGDIWIDISVAENQDLTAGNYGAHVLAHEIGHALGLSHPSPYNGGSPTYDIDAVYWQDSRAFSIMSYFGSSNIDGNLPEFSPAPQLHDIAAIQAIYGANTTTRSGDTTYGFNSNTGVEHYSLTSGAVGATFAIWDGGGNDTLDLSGYSEDAEIDLREEAFSSAGPTDLGPAVRNIAIARGAVIENAIGGSGNDHLIGNAVANNLSGGAGNDTLDGGAGADAMTGGLGDDTFIVDDLGDTVSENASEGADLVQSAVSFVLGANVENLTLTGIGNINGTGNALANTIIGNSGNNVLDGAAGADAMTGGLGDDTYVVDDAGDVVNENASEGTDTVQAAIIYVLGANLENLTLTGINNINGTGNALANTILGNSGNNLLIGGAGADVLDGGAGSDTADYSTSAAGVVVRLWNGTGEGGDAQGDTLTGVENVTGSAAKDSLLGDGLANVLSGGDGDDYLSGLNGNDTLIGGAGNDKLIGGAGADVLDGGAGSDTADYSTSAAGVVVRLWNGTGEGGDAQGDTLTGVENLTGSAAKDSLLGDGLANLLSGGGGDDYLAGLNGNDTLVGGAGNDKLIGGAGADALDGGAGVDTADYSASAAGVVVRLWNGTGEGGDAQGDTLTGVENVTGSAAKDSLLGDANANLLSGGGGDDYLAGLNGNDTLVGGAGNDKLIGGAGSDILNGGAGADNFVFDSLSGVDQVQDFQVGVDRITLTTSVFTAIGAGALSPNALVIGTAATTAAEHVIYDAASGALFYDADGSGAGAAVQIATLQTGLALTSGDFFGN